MCASSSFDFSMGSQTSMGAQTDWLAKDLRKLMFNIWFVAFCLISYQEICVYTKLVASIYFENSFKT